MKKNNLGNWGKENGKEGKEKNSGSKAFKGNQKNSTATMDDLYCLAYWKCGFTCKDAEFNKE